MDYLTYLRAYGYGDPNYMMSQGMVMPEKEAISVPWPLDFQNKSTQYLLNKAISGVKDSVADEKNDELFYDFLISKAPNKEQKEIIQSIRDDEKIHNSIFRKIFTQLNGVNLPVNQNISEVSNENLSYLEGLRKAFMGELEAVRRYREIAAYMPTKELYDMVFYVLTDEMRHATLYNYLMMLNLNT